MAKIGTIPSFANAPVLAQNIGMGAVQGALTPEESGKTGQELYKEQAKQGLIGGTVGAALTPLQKLIGVLRGPEQTSQMKQAIQNASQYYKVMSYRSFYRRVLGEKIIEKKVIEGNKIKVSYKKTEEGDFERDISLDRLHNLNNSLIIVDEAHNLTGNAYGEALQYIIKNSINLIFIFMCQKVQHQKMDHLRALP